ncbi:hypothetical protein JVT61DRAFT_14503 [Boletus reticuloceps]|uniref:Uncharacterized protein n=1 Tax=Boletus reticuloceps TaxID=495285 RepID=A0A8I3AAA9_9AGAM|nr:hypothetical protein JVT61DRAFT_14503 [Boletus reticuloceps]
MYNKSRIVLCMLLMLCAVTIIVYATAAAMYDNPDDYLTSSALTTFMRDIILFPLVTNPQVLNVSFCAPTYTTSSKLGRYKAIPWLTLAALLFILVVAKLCMESFQMYKATNQWKTNQYLNLLVMEGVFYFLVHLLNNVNFGDGNAGSVMTMLIFSLMFILSPRFIMNVRELYLHKLHHGNGWDKGIDSGFGVWDGKSSQLLFASFGGSSDVRTPGVVEGDMEMQRVEIDIGLE